MKEYADASNSGYLDMRKREYSDEALKVAAWLKASF